MFGLVVLGPEMRVLMHMYGIVEALELVVTGAAVEGLMTD